jgi:hypothetical protein
VDLLKRHPVTVEAAQHHPAALCTEIDGDHRSAPHDPISVLLVEVIEADTSSARS